jgi:hypothetical protein
MAEVKMIVRRDGYWDGIYARHGDTITVDPYWVKTLEHAGFAAVAEREAPEVAAKGTKHGR